MNEATNKGNQKELYDRADLLVRHLRKYTEKKLPDICGTCEHFDIDRSHKGVWDKNKRCDLDGMPVKKNAWCAAWIRANKRFFFSVTVTDYDKYD